MVVFGHGTQREEFDLSKIKRVRVIDSQGKDIPDQKEKKEKGLALKITGQPAAIMAEIDNGYWSKTIYGWKELPKRKASRVVEAIRSLFYTKTFISWGEAVQAASSGARLDIVPMKNPFEMKAGDSLPLKVLLSGKPLPGAEVIGPDHAKLGTADKDGLVRIPLVKGNNLVTVEYKERIKDDPDADALSLTATLTFEVKR
jgi:nickel transport protein